MRWQLIKTKAKSPTIAEKMWANNLIIKYTRHNALCTILSVKLISLAIPPDTYTNEIEEHKTSIIARRIQNVHRGSLSDLNNMFSVVCKCKGKFYCLIFEMFIWDLKLLLNAQ